MKLAAPTMVAALTLALGGGALAQSPSPSPKPAATPKKVTQAVAVLHPTQGNSVEGTVHFTASFNTPLLIGSVLTAVSTHQSGRTFEFSQCQVVTSDGSTGTSRLAPRDAARLAQPGDRRPAPGR